MASLPGVTYVMPVLNEQDYVEAAVSTVLGQDYSGPVELILAVGPSTDATADIVGRLAQQHSTVTVVQNDAGDVSTGLNLAIGRARHAIIARVDAHTALPAGYTERAVTTLLDTGAAAVGAVMVACGAAGIQAAVADAYNSSYGLGGGAYHRSGATPGPAESAYLGVMRRDAFLAVGGFDTTLRRGQDWELNHRLRQAGYVVWLDPELRVDYWPRASLSALRRQMYATGIWRGEIVRRVRRRSSPRYFAPPLLVLASLATAVLGALLAFGIGSWIALAIVALGPLLYLCLLALVIARHRGGLGKRMRFALVLGTMHLSWGVGFLRGLVRGADGVVDTSRLSAVSKDVVVPHAPWTQLSDGGLVEVDAIRDLMWDLEPVVEQDTPSTDDAALEQRRPERSRAS